jgi:polysaccharide biosynthesis transport protein
MDTRSLVPTVVDGSFPALPMEADFGEMPMRDLRNRLRVLMKYQRLAIVVFAAVFGAVALAVALTPRAYTASARIMVARESPIQLRLEGNVLRLGEGDANVRDNFNATQVAALQSRDVAERVIRERHLERSAAFAKPLTIQGRLLGLFGARRTSAVAASLAETADAEVDPDLVDRYMGFLDVQSVRGTDLIEVSFTTGDPELSASLAKDHVDAFVALNAEIRSNTEEAATSFLAKQIREARHAVDNAEAALRAFAAAHPNVAVNQEQNSVSQKINEISSLLTAAEAERTTLQSRYDFLAKPGGDPLPYFLDEPPVQKLRLELLDLQAQIASAGQRLGPQHPQMIELDRHKKEVEGQLRAEIANQVRAVRSKFEAAQLREQRLQAQLAGLEKSSTALRDSGGKYESLKKDVEAARRLHDSLLKQQRDTSLDSELAPLNVRVVESARMPDAPSEPKVFLDLLLGLVASLMLAAGAVVARAYFDSTVTSSEEVEEFLQLPTLAAIPRFAPLAGANGRGAAPDGKRREKSEIVVLREPWSQIAEAFRTMRTGVLFSACGTRTTPKVILVTSALAGEGKTVGSLNLAAALAEAGARVLLVDADLRHARCHEALGAGNERGLSTLLSGTASPQDLVQALPVQRLSFVAAGPRPANPVELVESDGLREAFEHWRNSFNFIVVDSPPALLVSDAVVLAQQADGVVLVVKGDETPRDVVRRARNRLVRTGAQILGVVLNSVVRDWDDLYYGYDEHEPLAAPEERSA